ncbi:MAG: hypothetical protein ACFFD1_00050 [Candidatus Thorarchaeota archaeon]
MALFKYINGKRIQCDVNEESTIQAEWLANDPTASANLKISKKKIIKEKLKNKLQLINDINDRQVIIAKALKILAKYITITDQNDQTALINLKTEFNKSIDLVDYAQSLESSVDADETTDIENDWPI